MKDLIFQNFVKSFLLSFVLSGCITKPYGVTNIVGTPVSDGWFIEEQYFASNPAKRGSTIATSAYRRGTTTEGNVYTIYPDGSGGISVSDYDIFSGWDVSCLKDAMTDRRMCVISSHNAGVLISYGDSSSPQYICLSDHDYPNKKGSVRIGSSKPILTDVGGCIPGKYAKRLSLANTVTTRSYKWPYNYPRDEKKSLEGIKSAMGLVKFIQNNIDNLQF